MQRKRNISAYIFLILSMVLWGSSFIALKIAYRAYHPMFIMFVRLLISSFIFLPFLKGFKSNYKKGDFKWLILMALFEPCLYFTFEAEALRLTTASQAAMICSLLPILVAIPSYFYLKEKISLSMIGGFMLAIAGSLWLSLASTGSEAGPNPIMGNTLEFFAMLCATGYTVSVKKMGTRYSAVQLTAIQAFVGTPYFLIRAFIAKGAFPAAFHLEPALAILFLAVFVSTLAYMFYAAGIQKTGASTSSIFINLIPVITLILSILILKETIGPIQLAASGLILLGVFISQMKRFS
jgi:drug/metabolite transporter (DMT)-like permease